LSYSTDWVALYSQLMHLGVSDPLFHAERFHKIPIKLLENLGEDLTRQKQYSMNADSVAVAKLSCLVYGALGGKKNGVTIESFLPFTKITESKELKDSTVAAMKWAIKNRQLPPAIVGMIGAELA